MEQPKMPQQRTAEMLEVKLFIMDAPNVDMALQTILGHRPTRAERPSMKLLMAWLQEQTKSYQTLYAKVFVNEAPDVDQAAKQKRWLEFLTAEGFEYLCKPRLTPGSDVDEDMLAYLELFRTQHYITEVIVASNDGQCFNYPLEVIAKAGILVTVIGFEQRPSVLTRNPLFRFIPLPSIPGVLRSLPTVPTTEEAPQPST